jgi:integrase
VASESAQKSPTFEAWVYSKRDRKKIRKSFPDESAAKLWRADARVQLSRGAMRAPKPITLREAWDSWYDQALKGVMTTKGKQRFKPSTLRAYEQAMRLRILPEFGTLRLADLDPLDLQDFADRLRAGGLSGVAVQGTFRPLSAVLQRARKRGTIAANPCELLELPAATVMPKRIATWGEAKALIEALPKEDQAVWATAFASGLRLGELQALRWGAVDLAGGWIYVREGWDAKVGPIKPKTRTSIRSVPLRAGLRDRLLALKSQDLRADDELVFGPDGEHPFVSKVLQERADRAWEAAGLERITYHGCRHSFASHAIAAGVDFKRLSTYMGHASISITIDLYGHLMPGHGDEFTAQLDAFEARQDARAADTLRAADTAPDTPATARA